MTYLENNNIETSKSEGKITVKSENNKTITPNGDKQNNHGDQNGSLMARTSIEGEECWAKTKLNERKLEEDSDEKSESHCN